ncbi:MAG TPA: NAD(P)/FAD-dependent oxidoreductase [Streptosporangiaceae bacterium]|nr:NAD(P)/FAD-dependent oxidoreductase [Streptosporangiaceae bacterium]
MWRRNQRGAAGPGRPRVIVAGAGFAGLAATGELARGGAEVLLIDRNTCSTFQPLLYQVATGGLNPGDVSYPARAFTRRHGARFRLGEVTGVDPAARTVRLADGAELGYDYLVLATGVSAAYYGVTGAAEHSLGLYTRRDAIGLRNHIMARLERLDIAGPGREVNFTVVGGGATGVELAGALAELRATALDAAFPEVDLASVHIRLVEQAAELLLPFDPRLREYARRQLAGRGVEVLTGTAIEEVRSDRVILAGGAELPSDVTVWAAGVTGPAELAGWNLPRGPGGRILVGPDLRVHGQDRVFALGDVALIEDQPLPQLAQPALQAGRHAARQIQRLAAGQPATAFRYHDKGIMATIGRRSAVVELPHRIRVRGTLAWLAWLALHLITLLGHRNRMSALLNLSWRYLAWGHGGGLIVGDDPLPLPDGLLTMNHAPSQ